MQGLQNCNLISLVFTSEKICCLSKCLKLNKGGDLAKYRTTVFVPNIRYSHPGIYFCAVKSRIFNLFAMNETIQHNYRTHLEYNGCLWISKFLITSKLHNSVHLRDFLDFERHNWKSKPLTELNCLCKLHFSDFAWNFILNLALSIHPSMLAPVYYQADNNHSQHKSIINTFFLSSLHNSLSWTMQGLLEKSFYFHMIISRHFDGHHQACIVELHNKYNIMTVRTNYLVAIGWLALCMRHSSSLLLPMFSYQVYK